MTSVTIGRPVSSRAFASHSSPCSPSPWKLYGEDRGLNAPPRSTVAPASRTRRAVSTICRSVSTEHGPAITTTSSPPTVTPPGRRTSVPSGCQSRETCRYGSVTGMRSRTPGRSTNRAPSTLPGLPRTATAVRPRPTSGRASYPISSTRRTTASTCSGVAPRSITTSIPRSLRSAELEAVAVAGERDGSLVLARHEGTDVHLVDLRVEVRQDEPLGGRRPRHPPDAPRRQVAREHLLVRQRALRQQQVRARRPPLERLGRPRVAGVDQPSLGGLDRERDALGGVRGRVDVQRHLRPERERLPRLHVEHPYGIPRIQQPVPEPGR